MKTDGRLVTLLEETIVKHRTVAILLAAGSSTRMGKARNKQLEVIGGAPVLAHSLLAYQKCPLISEIIVAARPCDFDAIVDLAKTYHISKLRHVVAGGATRQESAERALEKLDASVRYIAVADGARCLVTPTDITRVCLKAYRKKAASAGHLVADTVKRTNAVGAVKETVDRTGLWQAQTPQVFHASLYQAALLRAKGDGFTATDDNSLIEHLGYRVYMVECGGLNIKITTPEDLTLAEAILRMREEEKV